MVVSAGCSLRRGIGLSMIVEAIRPKKNKAMISPPVAIRLLILSPKFDNEMDYHIEIADK